MRSSSSVAAASAPSLLRPEFFQPLIDHLLAIDPDTVLAPVAEAIAGVQQQLRGFDIRAQVLGGIQQVFDDILARFEEFDPTALGTQAVIIDTFL